uniref:Uncharacterized protein n=1 Tax=Panagrolaimus davidi TaxID=227884 RepID=A0A914PW77_9BILA
MEYRNFETASGKKLELMVLSSLYHIEVTPSDIGIHDRILLFLWKLIHTLSKDAQHALRRTMEKYAGSCKIIMCCNSLKSCLKAATTGEHLDVSDRFHNSITERSNGNLRRAMLLLESSAAQYGKKLDSQKVIEPDWQCYIRDTATIILKSCTSDGLLKVRTRIFDLLTQCIPKYVIFEELLEAVLPHCDATFRHHVIESAAHFEHTAVLGSKDVYHLDVFMAIYKNHQILSSC